MTLAIDASQYSFITCSTYCNGTTKLMNQVHSKLIHNDDVEFRLQQLQIAYPKYNFTVTRCRP